MAYTVQQLLSDIPLLVNFLTEPAGWEESDATHWITIVPVADANQNSFDIPSLNSDRINEIVSFFSQENVRFDLSESGELYSTNKCVKLTAQLPYLIDEDQGLESTEYDLGHKVLVRVESERVGIGGNYHFVTIVDPNPDINGLTGYIKFENAIKLPDTPHSLPIALDTCLDQLGKPEDICSFATTIWHKTREPYYDQDSCHYSVSVVTEFTDTGNEQLRDRMLAQIEPGVRRLLEYYNKQRDESTIDRLLTAFEFAEAPSWHIDPKRSNSKLKVLVTVHAKYFDAIAEQDESVDLDDISSRTGRTIFLLSSEIRDHISSIVATMYGYDEDYNWLRAQAGWAGPGDEFGHFSFKEQAEDLELFIPNFERFFTLNNFALRGDYPDAIEIGLTDQGQMTYVSVTAPEIGSKMFKVGFKSLASMSPFNNPRTLGYVQRSREFFQEYEKNGGSVSGGWQRFIKYYTNPSPEYSVENREKCRPTLTNPFKCIPNNFRNYLDNHKQDPKCFGIPPDKQIGNINNRYGKKLWKDIKTGVSNLDPDGGGSPYSGPSKPVKWGDFLEVERKDLVGFTKYLNDADSDLGYDFVGDREFERAFNNIKKRQSAKNSMQLPSISLAAPALNSESLDFGKSVSNAAIDSLNDLLENVISKFPLEDITNELLQCACRQIRCKVEDLEELGEFDKAREYSLKATALGCDNVCGVIPILCSCIPIEFPPKLTLPMWPLPTVDIMAFIPALIINGIVSAFLSFVVDFMTGMLDDLREMCQRKGFCGADGPKDEFLKFFNNLYPFDSDEYFQAQEIQENFSAFPVITSSVLSSLLRDASTILSPREFCQVINGEADIDTLMLLEALVEESYPEVRGVFTNTERIRNLFVSLGRLIDPAICANLISFMDSTGVSPVNHMCDDTVFRDNLLNGRANREQIRDFLDDALKCDTDRLDNLIKTVEAISRGEDVLESILPPIFQTPSQPNGLIPRDPPSVQYLGDLVTNSIFESVENVFHGEVDQHIPTLVTTNDELETGESDQEQENTLVGFLRSLNPGETAAAQTLGLNLPFGFSPSLQGATLADSIKDRLLGLSAPIISESDNRFITLQLPNRKIKSAQIDDTNSPMAASSGLSILKPVDPGDFYNEQAKILYNLCPAAPGAHWATLRDAYSIDVKTRVPTEQAGYNTNFNFTSAKAIDLVSKFAISRNFDGEGQLLGVKSPFEEAFANFVAKKWSGLTISEEAASQLFDSNGDFYNFNLNLVEILNKSFIENIAANIGRSKFLKPDTLNGQLDELRKISFRPDPSCGRTSRVPGLLNIGDINQKHKDAYEGSEKDNPARYVDATTYALSLIYIRVCLSQMLLDGVFPFSYFKVKDILTSDLIVRYFLNRFKNQFRDNEFYRLMATAIREVVEEDLARNGSLLDPITNQPVEIVFGDVQDISFSQVESSNSCVSPQVLDENCVLIGPTELSAEITDGAIGMSGNKTIGYMEYVIKDQLRVMSDEFEALMQSQMVDLNFHIFKDYISTTDIAIFAEDKVSFSRLSSAANDEEFVQEILTNSRVQEYGFLVRKLRELFDGSITKEQLGYPFNSSLQDELQGEARQFVDAFHNFWTDMSLSSPAIQELRSSTIDVSLVIGSPNFGNRGFFGDVSIPLSGEIVPKPDGAFEYTGESWRSSHSFLFDQRDAIKSGVFNNAGPSLTTLSRLALRSFFDKSLSPGFATRLVGRSQRTDTDAWSFTVTRNMIGLDGINYQATDKSIDPSPNSWNTPLESVMDIAFKTITDIVTRESINGLDSALSRNFEYLENGGFITERYIEIEDYTDEQFEQILSQGDVPDPEFARQKIKNRPFYLKNVVNIDLWNSFVQGLVAANDKLDLFEDVSGTQQFNLSKYFRNWKFGERLALVYPIGDKYRALAAMLQEGGAQNNFNFFVRETLANEISDDIQKDKSYYFKEIMGGDALLTAARAAGLLDEGVENLFEANSETIDIYSVPLISKSRGIDSKKLKDLNAATRVSDILDDIEQVVTSLFTTDMTEDLKNLVGEFNNLILPTDDYHPNPHAGMPIIERNIARPSENFRNGNLEYGDFGLDDRYAYSHVTFARDTHIESENTNAFLDSLGDEVTYYSHGFYEGKTPLETINDINSRRFVEPEFANLEDVKNKIADLSIRLFGWNIFDSYDLRTTLPVEEFRENPTKTTLDYLYNPPGEYELPQIYDPKGYLRARRPSLAHWFVRLNYPQSGQTIDEIPTHLTSNQLESGESSYNFSSHWRFLLESAYEPGVFSQSDYDQTTEQGEGSSVDIVQSFSSMIGTITDQKWSSAANFPYGRGGLFLIYAEVSDIKTKLREFKSEFGNLSNLARLTPEQKGRLRGVLQRINRHLQNQIEKPFEVGKNSINRCFFDGNPDNISPANRPFASLCQEYEYLNRSLRQLNFYIRNLDDAQAVPPIRDLSLYYESDFRSILRDDIVNTEEYAVMFNYIFPMPRLHSLLAMYCIEHTSKLPGREGMFDQTKQLIEQVFKSTLESKEQDWWRKNKTPERPPSWLDSSLADYIPPWLIILLTPFKILQALLILVPPLKWLLSLPGGLDDFLKNMLPPYRKDKNSDEDPCR